MHKLYVYGTLRPNGNDLHKVPGVLYDLGWFPGIELGDESSESFVTCEVLEVSDNRLKELDHYEGYCEGDDSASLYLRVPYLDGFIYVYNQSLEGKKVISSGDWRAYQDGKVPVCA